MPTCSNITNGAALTLSADTLTAGFCHESLQLTHNEFVNKTTVSMLGANVLAKHLDDVTGSEQSNLLVRLDDSCDPFGLYYHNGTKWVPADGSPIGTVQPYAGSTAPVGWLFCDNSTYNGSTSPYDLLYDVIGTTYGGSSSAFNVPDMRGRVAAGQDDMGGASANRLTNPATTTGGIDGDVLGGTGGSEVHQLTEAQVAAHTHTFTHVKAGGSTIDGADAASLNHQIVSEATDPIVGDVAHNNVQPTMILNYIIRYA